MRKIDNEILKLCVVILADVLSELKDGLRHDHPIVILTSNAINALLGVGYNDNNKTLKSLQELYDSYNDGTLKETDKC